MAAESGPNLGQRALRALWILLFGAWAIYMAMTLLTAVWVQVVVVCLVALTANSGWYWWRRRL